MSKDKELAANIRSCINEILEELSIDVNAGLGDGHIFKEQFLKEMIAGDFSKISEHKEDLLKSERDLGKLTGAVMVIEKMIEVLDAYDNESK